MDNLSFYNKSNNEPGFRLDNNCKLLDNESRYDLQLDKDRAKHQKILTK